MMTTKSTRIAWAALTPLALLLGACGQNNQKLNEPPVANAPAPAPLSPPTQQAPSPAREGLIYVPSTDGTGDGNELVARKVKFDKPSDPAREALNALIAAPASPLPDGTELRGLRIEDGLATVNFSPELKSKFHGGDTQEAQAVNSILKTLGQFPSISKVQILVDGSPIDSLGEHFEISGPLDVIRTAEVKQARLYHKASSH